MDGAAVWKTFDKKGYPVLSIRKQDGTKIVGIFNFGKYESSQPDFFLKNEEDEEVGEAFYVKLGKKSAIKLVVEEGTFVAWNVKKKTNPRAPDMRVTPFKPFQKKRTR